MSIHDAYLRRTPAELLFPSPEEAEDRLLKIQASLEETGADVTDPMQVGMLPAVAEVLGEVRPAGDNPHAVHAYAFLLFFAYHLWRVKSAPWLITAATARAVASPDYPAQDWSGRIPEGVGYLQLPRNLFWVRPEMDGPAEPVDGIYWFVSPAGDLWVLVASGMRDGRPGFSAVALDAVPVAHARAWATETIREEGNDFASTLPGGDLDGLHSIETAGEALKLLARVHDLLESHPEALGEREVGAATQDGPTPSRMAYRRIRGVS